MLADAGAIRITDVRAGTGDQTEPAHVHAYSHFVLEGELALSAGERELRAPAGSWVEVPPGVAHRLDVAGPVSFLEGRLAYGAVVDRV